MNAILLNEQQTTLFVRSRDSIQVRDPSGTLLGHIVPGNMAGGQFHKNSWIECWNDWDLDCADREPEMPETD